MPANGFFSDYCLREGLLWLAHHAPLQPIVYPSDIRDLVLESLDPHLKGPLKCESIRSDTEGLYLRFQSGIRKN